MSEIPPSPRRLRAAQKAGLRPRSASMVLAGLAVGAWIIIDQLLPRAAGWLARALERGMDGAGPLTAASPTSAAALLIGLGLGAAALALLSLGRRRAQARLEVDPGAGEIPPWLALTSCALALLLLVVWLRPALAGAARSVDAPGLGPLWIVWTRGLGRGLLALAAVSAAVGVLERLVSAHRLWQGLHLTRAQARARARAAGDRRPRASRG